MADGRDRADSEALHPKGGRPAEEIFILRMWEDESAPGIWLGRVQHVLKGDARSFAGVGMLTECLAALLPRNRATGKAGQEPARLLRSQAAIDGGAAALLESRQAKESHTEIEGEE